MAADPPPMDDLFADESAVTQEDSYPPGGGSRMEDVVLSNPPRLDASDHASAAPTLRTTDDQRNMPVVAPFRSFEELGNKPVMRTADEVSF